MVVFTSGASLGHGVDFSVPRKGGAGQVPQFSAPPKPAIVRTLQESFGNQQPIDIDWVCQRKTKPDYEPMRRSSAGSLSPERRNPDFPVIVRQVSLEHGVHRRHVSAPTRHEPQNMVMRGISADIDAEMIGRDRRSRSPSPDNKVEHFQAERKPPLPDWAARKIRSRSPSESSIRGPYISHIRRTREKKMCDMFLDEGCSWGSSLAFENSTAKDSYSGSDLVHCAESCELSRSGSMMTLQGSGSVKNLSDASDGATNSALFSEVLTKSHSRAGFTSNYSDDGRSTTLGSAGGWSPTTAYTTSSFFTDTVRSDSSSLSTSLAISVAANSVVQFSQSVDQQFAASYEHRLQAMVKAEQKKAMKRAERCRRS